MERGIRLDLKTPGTGIGLAIVRDIADVYDLSIDIANIEAGGLRVRIGLTARVCLLSKTVAYASVMIDGIGFHNLWRIGKLQVIRKPVGASKALMVCGSGQSRQGGSAL